jgi:hypothetical protein
MSAEEMAFGIWREIAKWWQQKSFAEVVLTVIAAAIVLYLTIKVNRMRKELGELTRDIDLATNRFQAVAGDLRELIAAFDSTFSSKVAVPQAPLPTPISTPSSRDRTRSHNATPAAQNRTQSQVIDSGNEDCWDELREAWNVAKANLESRIETIDDRRRLRKYARMARYTYGEVIAALAGDGQLTEAQAASARAMNELFLRHRSRQVPVRAADIERFNGHLRNLNNP